MKRILIIHNYYQDAGGEDAVFEQETALLATVANVKTLRFFNRKGWKGLIQFALYPWNIWASRRLSKKIKSFKPDLVHIHNLHYASGPILIRTLHNRGIPVVMTLHNYRLVCPTATLYHAGELFTNSLGRSFPWKAVRLGVYSNSILKTFWVALTYALHRRLGTWKMVNRYLVLTEFARDLFQKYGSGIPPEKFGVKPNFLPQFASATSPPLRKAHFLFVGRLTEEKGVNVLLDAFRANGHLLRVAGDGPLRKCVEDATRTNPNIRYLGMLSQEQVIQEMRECTALIFPSLWFEGMPMTLIQAFATGTPLLCSRLGAMKTMVEPGYHGALFVPGSVEDLSRAVTDWIELSPRTKQQISINAYTTYQAHYTPIINQKLLMDQYEQCVDSPPETRSTVGPMITIGILFFIFGFVTWLNGPLITYAKLAFSLDTYAKAFMVTTAFYMAYFFLAIPSSWILEKTGMKRGMAIGLLVMAAGTFLFGTFATQRNYPISMVGLFIIGSGLSILQTASNPYVSILGPIESAAKRISIMGICNKLAGILSPIILSALVFSGVSDLETLVKEAPTQLEKDLILTDFAAKIYAPYMVMAAVLAALAFWIVKSGLPDLDASKANATPVGDNRLSRDKTSILQFPHLLLGALCIFLYVGAEVMAGDAIGAYAQGFSIPAGETAIYTSFTLGAMLVGYMIGLFTIPRIMSQEQALKISAVLGIIFSFGAYSTVGYVSVAFVALLGLANALMWPAIWPLAISGLGRFTEKGSALLIMGIAGGTVIPQLFATLKDKYDFQLVFLILMGICYLYIFYYSRTGHKVGK